MQIFYYVLVPVAGGQCMFITLFEKVLRFEGFTIEAAISRSYAVDLDPYSATRVLVRAMYAFGEGYLGKGGHVLTPVPYEDGLWDEVEVMAHPEEQAGLIERFPGLARLFRDAAFEGSRASLHV